MGLVSFWTNLTALRVKEISPASEDFWPERGRPKTSSAVRGATRDSGRDHQDSEKQSTVASSEKKRRRLVRSLSRPRRAHAAQPKAVDRPSSVEQNAEKDLPTVPSVPSNLVLRDDPQTDDAQPEDIGRPGTAITTEGLQALHIFELPAESSPSAEVVLTPSDNPLVRRRSKSLGPERQTGLSKRGPWFRGSSSKDKTLPLPPPPNCPLPPVPATQPLPQHAFPKQARAQSVDGRIATMPSPIHGKSRTRSADSQLGGMPDPGLSLDRLTNDSPTTSKSSSDEDSLLEAFPAVPGLVHDYDETPDPSVTNSEVGSLNQPTSPPRERLFVAPKDKKLPCPIQIGSAYAHKHKDSAIGTPKSPYTPHTPTGFKRWTRQFYGVEDEPVDPSNLSGLGLDGWTKQTDVSVIPEYESVDEGRTNDQALAALEFGVLK